MCMENKIKTVNISDKLHKKIKVYCAENDLKINNWIEEVLEKAISEKKK